MANLLTNNLQIEDKTVKSFNDQPQGGNLPFLKQEDIQYFDKLLTEVDEDTLSPEELKVRFSLNYEMSMGLSEDTSSSRLLYLQIVLKHWLIL